jgi:hypothetical protein
MKILLALLVLLTSLTSHALSRSQLEALLKEKGINLMEVEMQGMQVLMGEVSGHINAIPFSKVQILVTESEAILKSEIDSVDFSGAQNMGAVNTVRFNGQYVVKKDIKATIAIK